MFNCTGSLISCSPSAGVDTPIGVVPPEEGKEGMLLGPAFAAASFSTGSAKKQAKNAPFYH